MRYYFNTLERDRVIRDAEGLELADLSQARIEALEGARSMIADGIRSGRAIDRSMRFEVTDNEGNLLHSISVVEALEAEELDGFAVPPVDVPPRST